MSEDKSFEITKAVLDYLSEAFNFAYGILTWEKIENIVRDVINSHGVGVENKVMSEDKYMRAAVECVKYGTIERIAEAIKREIERPEPLIPGVRYKNTDENRRRIPIDNTTKESGLLLAWGMNYLPCRGWARETTGLGVVFVFPKERPFNGSVSFFALIPDGEVLD